MNHFAKYCRSSRKGSVVGQIQQPNESAPFVLSLNLVTSASKPFKTCSLELADTMVTLIIDIGGKVSILNDSFYRKHFSGYPLHPPEGTLSTYDSSEIPLEGIIHLPVTYQSETIQNFPFSVTQSGSSLMGLDLFDQLGFQVSKNGVIIQSVDIVSAFPSVFTGFGKIAKFVHRPRVKPEVTPVSQGLCRFPLSVREEMSRELKRLQDDGMIEPIDSSPWISSHRTSNIR